MNENFNVSFKEAQEICSEFEKEIENASNPNMFLETHVRLPSFDLPTRSKNAISIKIGSSFLKIVAYRIETNGVYKYIKGEAKFFIDKKTHADKNIWEWVTMHVKYYLQGIDIDFEGSITLSFPIKHVSLSEGYVIKTNKDCPFSKDTFINRNILESLNAQCAQRKIKIKFRTVLNDAVASSVASYFLDRKTVMSVILGTGTNSAVIIKEDSSQKKVINLEWAAFDSDKIKKTDYDTAIIQQLTAQNFSFNQLDVMLSGYKFVDICSMYCTQKGVTNKSILTFNNFITVLNKPEEERNNDEKIIYQCVNQIKKRTLNIISAMIVAVIKSLDITDTNITIVLDGHAFYNSKSRLLLSSAVNKFILKMELTQEYEINFKFIKNSALLGCAFSLFLADLYGDKKN